MNTQHEPIERKAGPGAVVGGLYRRGGGSGPSPERGIVFNLRCDSSGEKLYQVADVHSRKKEKKTPQFQETATVD